MKKMKVEVWSDIMCPFCYIGKRNYEKALSQFKDAAYIEIEWKSFQLDPTIPEGKIEHSVFEHLAASKGWSMEQCLSIHDQVTQTAKNAGLTYNFDIAKVCNSFNAHRIIQLAKDKGLGDQAEEQFFKAYFTDGKDLNDQETLFEIASLIGLTKEEAATALTDDSYAYRVKQDIHEAAQIGVRGVPFFVMNRRYAVSGAQAPEVFLETIEKAYEEWRNDNPLNDFEIIEGQSCDIDGNCN